MNNGVTNNTNNQTNTSGVVQTGQPVMTNTTLTTPTATPVANQQPVMNQQPQIIAQIPQIVQSVPVQGTTPVQPQQNAVVPQLPVVPEQPQNTNTSDSVAANDVKSKPKKGKINIVPILLVIIVLLGVYTFISAKSHASKIQNLTYNCTPVTASKEAKQLDLNSTLVKDLYSKVATTIREDLAQPEFNDNMRLYLAYRQIIDTDKYDSNCNLFDNLKMEPFTCEVSTNFRPKAFKEETLTQAIKKLYGENTTIPFENIRLGSSSCIGGYQYIPARGEFVQGMCKQQTATSYKVTKTLKEATSTRNTIVLTEEVKYHENEGMSLPEYLKSGMYYYTFRLDMNYNYVLVSKKYESKY